MGERMWQGTDRKRLTRWFARAALLLPFVLFASGCATYEPQPLEPERELAALGTVDLSRVVARDPSRQEGEAEVKAGLPIDPTDGLDDAELIAIALTLNPDLKTKRLEVGEAQALLITAGIWPNPEIGVSWRGALGGASGYNLDADLLFELLLPGVRSARKDAAGARIDASRARVVAAEWQVVASVREQSLAVLSAERLAALLSEEEALRQRIVSLFTRKRELGEGTELDVVTAELDLGQLQRDARLARAEVDRSRRALNELLGLPPTYAVVLAQSGKPIPLATPPEVSDDDLLKRLLHGRFELRALEAMYQEAEHSLRAAVYRQYPQLKLGPAFSHEGAEGDFLGVGLVLPLPFFDRNQGEIAEKQNLRDRRRAEYVTLLHNLRAQALEANAELRRARAELDAQEKALVPLLARTRALFEGAFARRDIGSLELALARQRALDIERGYLDAAIRYRRAASRLDAAMGLRGGPDSREGKP